VLRVSHYVNNLAHELYHAQDIYKYGDGLIKYFMANDDFWFDGILRHNEITGMGP